MVANLVVRSGETGESCCSRMANRVNSARGRVAAVRRGDVREYVYRVVRQPRLVASRPRGATTGKQTASDLQAALTSDVAVLLGRRLGRQCFGAATVAVVIQLSVFGRDTFIRGINAFYLGRRRLK